MLILKRSWNKLFAGLLVSIFIIVSCISGILIFEKPHQIFFISYSLYGLFLLVRYTLLSMPISFTAYQMNRKEARCWDLLLSFSSLASCTSSLVIGLTLDHIQPEYAFTLLFLPTIALSALFLNYKRQPIS